MFAHGGRFYISVDLEGIAGVIGEYGSALAFDSPGYLYAKKQATRETDAAVRALFDNGATEVYVWDSHGKGYNLDYESLDIRAKIVIGSGSGKRFPDIETGFDGVLFIGAHAYDTSEAVLSHVYSSATFQYMKINGEYAGEVQIDGAIAGKFGAPVIFVSGDDAVVAQAKKTIGDIPTVITKKALAFNSCISEHPKKVVEMIYRAVAQSAEKCGLIKPYTVSEPFDYEVRFKRIEYAEGSRIKDTEGNRLKRIDAYTVGGKVKKLEDIF